MVRVHLICLLLALCLLTACGDRRVNASNPPEDTQIEVDARVDVTPPDVAQDSAETAPPDVVDGLDTSDVAEDTAMNDTSPTDTGDTAVGGCEETGGCEECFACVDGACVIDDAALALDAPICDTFCATWPNRCTAILAFHQPARDGRCFDDAERVLCQESGGAWTEDLCAPRSCDEVAQTGCPAVCTFSCDCVEGASWDSARGCVPDPGCHDPGSCLELATCAGAWRRNGECFGPGGQPLDEACCAALVCGPDVETFFDPLSGECVSGLSGCERPIAAPSCVIDAGGVPEAPCDVGLLLRYDTGYPAGDCRGPGAPPSASALRLRPFAVNFSDAPQTLTLADQCPDGEARFAGLPEPFDYYNTCGDGACDTTGGPDIIELSRGIEALISWTDPISVEGQDFCNDPVASGVYTLSYTLPLIDANGAKLCSFTWLELRVVD